MEILEVFIIIMTNFKAFSQHEFQEYYYKELYSPLIGLINRFEQSLNNHDLNCQVK